LAYSQTYRVLHWINSARHFHVETKELRWFYQEGASYLFPDAWEHVKRFHAERDDMLTAYYKRLKPAQNKRFDWKRLVPGQFGKRARVDAADPELMQKFGESQFADAFARIECHYFINKGFFESEEQLLLTSIASAT